MKALMEYAGAIPNGKVLRTREERLKSEYREYQTHPDLRVLKTQSRFVPGGGSVNPTVMFIGDVPGVDEAKSAMPLMGKRMSIVMGLMRGVDLKEADMYVTHLLKYRTHKGRDPRELEIAASINCLLSEISILKPTVVVTWGRCVLDILAPGVPLQHAHGQLTRSQHGFDIVPMFSPDAALVNPHVTQLLIKDFQIVRELA